MLACASAPVTAADSCASFETGRLTSGASFIRPIGHGLEVRLRAKNGDPGTWDISVGPVGSKMDYLWVASPPYQTAPHLTIGSGYGGRPVDSARFSPRHLRFVTSKVEYDRARAAVDRALHGSTVVSVKELQRLGHGRLDLSIRDFAVNPSSGQLDWIRVTGRACRPVRPPR